MKETTKQLFYNTFLIVMLIGYTINIHAQTHTYTFETATGVGTSTASETVAGVTLDLEINGRNGIYWLIDNGSSFGATNKSAFSIFPGIDTYSNVATFSSNINLTSILFAGYGDDAKIGQYIFTPIGGSNSAVTIDASVPNPSATINLNWTNITGFTITATYMGNRRYFQAIYDTFIWEKTTTFPTVTTNTASTITKNTAVLAGNITSQGDSPVTERGIIYATANNNLEIGEAGVTKNTNGTGTGVFTKTISGLTEETTYYYRAYAINSSGTGYGEIKNFTTLGVSVTSAERENPSLENLYENTVTYKVTFSKPVKDVAISDFTTNSAGATINNVTQISTTVYEVTVNNITANGDVFLQIKGVDGVTGNNNITTLAVPGTINTIVNQTQDDDWLNQSYIGQSFTATSSNSLSKVIYFPKEPQHTFSGTAMLRFYTGEQLNPDLNAADYSQEVTITDSGDQEFVFTTPQNLTSGQKYTILLSDFLGSGSQAFIGSLDGDYHQGRAVFVGHNNNYPNYDLKIKIEEETIALVGDITLSTAAPTINEKYTKLTPPTLPAIETTNATNVTSTSATLGGTITHQGQSAVTERGIVYSTTDTNPKIGDADVTKDTNGSGTGVFSKNIAGLTANTIYYYRAYATNTEGTAYGNVKSFSLNNALNFDGTNDRVTIADNPAFYFSNGFTAEAWIHPNELSTQTYLSQYGVGQEAFAFILLASGKIEFSVTTDGSTDQYFESSTTISAGEWTHVVLTFDGTIMKAYINGTAAGTKAVSGTIFNSTAPIEIGARDNNYFFNGSIDEVRIWTRVLTETEINNQKNGVLPSNAYGLVAYYQFNQGVAEGDNSVITTLTDSSTNNLNGTLEGFTKTGATSNFVAGATGNFSNATIAANTFSTSGNWSTPGNWSLGFVPTQVDRAIIGDGKTVTIDVDDLVINDFELENDAVLVIPTDRKITVQNSFTSNGTLELSSDKTNSGVLLVEGTSTGTVTYKRGGLFANKWSIITPPVAGQKIKEFAENAANNIRKRTDLTPNKYAIAYYDDSQPSGQKWVYYFADMDANLEFEPGRSYSMSRATYGEVSFTGTLTVEDLQKTLIAGQWNAIGNPFTTYFPANKNSSNSFLSDNMDVLNDTYPSLYVWDNDQEKYVAVTEIDETARSLPPGQGFFIKMKEGETEITFNKNKRTTKPASGNTFFNKTINATPSINIKLSDGEYTVDTTIKYFENTTTGFDKGYDIGNFNSDGLDIFTRLIGEANETNFTIQSLPANNYENMVVPIGINAKAGQEITFSASSKNIPSGYNIFLEDKILNVFTQLNEENASYKVTLSENATITNRFFLHLKAKTLSTNNHNLKNLNVYQSNKSTLTITGLNNQKASIKIISILGKKLFNTTIHNPTLQIPTSLKPGIYIVTIISDKRSITKKIILK